MRGREAEEAGTHILFSNSTATAVKWRKGRIVRALWISADDGQRECAGARGIISFRLYNIARDIDVPSPDATIFVNSAFIANVDYYRNTFQSHLWLTESLNCQIFKCFLLRKKNNISIKFPKIKLN